MKSMATPAGNDCAGSDQADPTRMTRRALTLALASAGLAACSGQRSWGFRYLLRIQLRAGGQLYEASGAFRTIYRRVSETSLNQTRPFHARGWGEAVPIDLGAGGLLIGLLGSVAGIEAGHDFSPVNPRTLVQLLPSDISMGESLRNGAAFDAVRRLDGEHNVPANSWPLFAHLSDSHNPATARFVQLQNQRYRLTSNTSSVPMSVILGGAEIERITIELADQPVTRRIERVCPWVSDTPGAGGGYYRGGSHAQPFGERLVYRNLRMEGLTR
jgi:hypothetical protein